MMKNSVVFVVCSLLVAFEMVNSCSPTTGVTPSSTTTTTTPASGSGGRKRRDISDVTKLKSPLPAMISALTFYKFNETKNKENANSVEDQLKEFVSVEQINESKFGKAERILGDDKGFLRVSYTLSKGSRHCEELISLATKAINLADNIAEGDVICNNEKIEIQKIE